MEKEQREPREQREQRSSTDNNNNTRSNSGYNSNNHYNNNHNSNNSGNNTGPVRRMTKRRKVCAICAEKLDDKDYKDVARIKRFLSERSKILPRRITGNCAKHQRILTTAVKRARHIALIPYISD